MGAVDHEMLIGWLTRLQLTAIRDSTRQPARRGCREAYDAARSVRRHVGNRSGWVPPPRVQENVGFSSREMVAGTAARSSSTPRHAPARSAIGTTALTTCYSTPRKKVSKDESTGQDSGPTDAPSAPIIECRCAQYALRRVNRQSSGSAALGDRTARNRELGVEMIRCLRAS